MGQMIINELVKIGVKKSLKFATFVNSFKKAYYDIGISAL